jgi:hypothetical protein
MSKKTGRSGLASGCYYRGFWNSELKCHPNWKTLQASHGRRSGSGWPLLDLNRLPRFLQSRNRWLISLPCYAAIERAASILATPQAYEPTTPSTPPLLTPPAPTEVIPESQPPDPPAPQCRQWLNQTRQLQTCLLHQRCLRCRHPCCHHPCRRKPWRRQSWLCRRSGNFAGAAFSSEISHSAHRRRSINCQRLGVKYYAANATETRTTWPTGTASSAISKKTVTRRTTTRCDLLRLTL